MGRQVDRVANMAKQEIKKHIRNKAIAAIANALISLISLIVANIIPIIIAVGVIAVVGFFTDVFSTIFDEQVDSEMVSDVSSTGTDQVTEMATTAFYTKYSDQSYYYFLLEPTEKDLEELEIYLSDTYENLGGIKAQDLTQANETNYVEDVDDYEDVVKIGYSKLAYLDQYLNKARDGGYYNPEQFIKLPYLGKVCSILDENFDVEKWGCVTKTGETATVTCEVDSHGNLTSASMEKGCSMGDDYKAGKESWTEEVTAEKDITESLGLGDLDEAESTKYQQNEDGTFSAVEGETELSTSDYGLASIVRYKAYLQPSRVTDYKLKNVTYVDSEWEYDNGGSPLTYATWTSLDEEQQNYILTTFKNDKNDNSNKYSSKNGAGMLSGSNLTGIYDVEEEIVYNKWSDAFSQIVSNDDYGDLKWSEYASSDPGISTGIYETTVAYAIDKAITFMGDLDLKVSYKWVELSDSTHTQYGEYVKDYTSKNGTNFNNYKLNSIDDATGYKRLYDKDGKLLGYIAADSEVKWVKGTISNDSGEKGKQVPEIFYYFQGYDKDGKECFVEDYGDGSCVEKRVSKTVYKTEYSITYTKGYWEAHLVKDANFNDTDETIYFGKKDDVEEYSGEEKEKYTEIKNKYKSENSKADEYIWYYQPTYIFTVSAYTKGSFEMKLVSHSGNTNTKVTGGNDYFDKYLKNYVSYINDEEEVFTNCYRATNSGTIETDENGKIISSSLDSVNVDVTTDSGDGSGGLVANSTNTACETKQFRLVSNTDKAPMERLEFTGITELQKLLLEKTLSLNYETDSGDIAITEESIETQEVFDSTIKSDLAEIKAKYKDNLKKAEEKYGIDQNLLINLIYVAQNNSKLNNLTGLYCDATTGCSLGEVDIFDNARQGTTESFTISTKSTASIINGTAAKMQTLLKRYDGNLLIALLDYNIGEEGTKKVLELYEKSLGIPSDEAIEDLYDTTWFHFVDEVVSNPDKYGVSINEGAYYKFVYDCIYNMKTTSISWRFRTDDENVHVNLWKRIGLEDKISNISSNKDWSIEKIRAMFYLKKNNSENLKKYWKIISNNYKSWTSGKYLYETGEYKLKTYTKAIKVQPNLTDVKIKTYKPRILVAGSDVDVNDARKLSNAELLSKIGSSNKIKIKPNYKTYLGSITTPASQYKTIDYSGFTVNSYVWIIETEKDAEIYSITKGEVIGVGKNTVQVYLEKKNAYITYTGFSEISVEKGDSLKKKGVLGKSSGRVSIELEIDNETYSMKDFVDQYLALQNSSSSAWSSQFTGSFGSYAGKLVENPEEMWDVILSYIGSSEFVSGAAMDNQCTEFVNFMIQKYWGIHGENIAGDGSQKVEEIKNVLGDRASEITNDLSDFGDVAYNIVFSWSDGDAGHTGYINEYNADEGYVIVSQGNVCDGGIQWKYKYTLEEWESVAGDSLTYITLADENYQELTDDEVWDNVEIVTPYEIEDTSE